MGAAELLSCVRVFGGFEPWLAFRMLKLEQSLPHDDEEEEEEEAANHRQPWFSPYKSRCADIDACTEQVC